MSFSVKSEYLHENNSCKNWTFAGAVVLAVHRKLKKDSPVKSWWFFWYVFLATNNNRNQRKKIDFFHRTFHHVFTMFSPYLSPYLSPCFSPYLSPDSRFFHRLGKLCRSRADWCRICPTSFPLSGALSYVTWSETCAYSVHMYNASSMYIIFMIPNLAEMVLL